MDGQMKRGVLEMCILQVIGQRRRYGYEVMKEITAAFPDVNESTAYAVLRRLRGDGKLEVSQDAQDRRKYYTLTEAGTKSLAEAVQNWSDMRNAVSRFGIQ